MGEGLKRAVKAAKATQKDTRRLTVKCAQCGAKAIYEGDAEGYWCPNCGASDQDE